jgi:dienelactone hydrolase
VQSNFLASVIALAISAPLGVSTQADAQTAPPIGGDYTNAIPIPVDDPTTKNISGALFKPDGAGPFPAVVYMSGCAGLNIPPEANLERATINHYLTRGVATLILDPFTPRSESGMGPDGLCEKIRDPNLSEKVWLQYATRGGSDAVAAVKLLRSMPDIDPDHIFLQGYSIGAASTLSAVDSKTPGAHDVKIAGVIAYYPYCRAIEFSAPALILIGDKDDWAPAALCTAMKGKPNTEVVVYPGATHSFTYQPGIDYLGHHMAYDEGATRDAQQRTDAFMAAHMPPK